MFSKILIANRGEIACRIIKTARRMGMATVAVYSDADKNALHVRSADEAVRVGPAPSAQSYLDIHAIVDACRTSGADAVHPGYGFLSENADFAEALEAAGVAFIGPPAAAIRAMGDKITSKALAKKAGVNTIPGHPEVVADAAAAVEIAEQIGYPVMIKASAGGGGKGMRVAYDGAEAAAGFTRASSEALSSFGDGRILIEKFIEQPRHIEIQIMADTFGNMVALHERECSIQRRHQKVIEEAPSPFIDAATRAAMVGQALALARSVDYVSAGTVELVVDAQRNFYFLEMNTRLQVEHPVTEMITGLDLVEWMIRIAAGEKLPITQSEVALDGWAMESRVYAENPFKNFMPSSGRLTHYRPPKSTDDGVVDEHVHDAHVHDAHIDVGEHAAEHSHVHAAPHAHHRAARVRVDSGVEAGSESSRFYDPMLAKLVVWGADRAAAIAAMRQALDEYYIRGVATNLPFAAAIMAHPKFRMGDFATDFIARAYPKGFARADQAPGLASDAQVDSAGNSDGNPGAPPLGIFIAIAAVWHHRNALRAATIGDQLPGPARAIGPHWVVAAQSAYYDAEVGGAPGRWRVRCGGEAGEKHWLIEEKWRAGEPVCRGRVNGAALTVQIEARGHGYELTHGGCQIALQVLTPRTAQLHALMPAAAAVAPSRFLLSPMPGLLVSVAVEAGAQVKAGDELAVVEAMKMENALCAEQDGVVAAVLAQPGATVEAEQALLEFAAAQ